LYESTNILTCFRSLEMALLALPLGPQRSQGVTGEQIGLVNAQYNVGFVGTDYTVDCREGTFGGEIEQVHHYHHHVAAEDLWGKGLR